MPKAYYKLDSPLSEQLEMPILIILPFLLQGASPREISMVPVLLELVITYQSQVERCTLLSVYLPAFREICGDVCGNVRACLAKFVAIFVFC